MLYMFIKVESLMSGSIMFRITILHFSIIQKGL